MKFVGAMTGTMSGSLGGVTASHNRGGQYLRQRVVPTNPNTTPQAAVRSYMGSSNSTWQMLTDSDRALWNNYAANVPTVDSLGQELVLTGQQMFIRSNITRNRIGLNAPAAGPTIFNRGQPVVLIQSAIAGDPQELGIATAALSSKVVFMDAIDSSGDVILQIGRPVSPAVNYYRGPYCLVNSTPVSSLDTDATLTATPVADFPFATLTAGQRRPVRLVVALDDGRVSHGYETICEVVADS